MSSQSPIAGIYVPNLVPYTPAGEVDEAELRRLVSWLIERGVHGLYPNGSTGEFIRLSYEERRRVIEIVASETRGRVPILAGAAEANIRLILDACEHYASLGCRAVSLTGPYYYKVSQDSIELHFREIASRSPIDILVYNIPQFANEISLPVLKRLALDCPRIIGTKDSSRDLPRVLAILHHIKSQRPDFVVLSGTEEILLPSLLMGVDGGTIATAGIVPELVLALFHAFQSGQLDRAKRLQFDLLDLIEPMIATGNFPDGFRAAATLRGFHPGPPRHPASPRETEMLQSIRDRLACLFTQHGFSEAASACAAAQSRPASAPPRDRIEAIVRAVLSEHRS